MPPMPAPQRIVIKIGTGVLTRSDGVRLDESTFVEIARAIAELHRRGDEVILVSSGAVGAGLMEYGRTTRPESTAGLQAFAAIGQARLMQTWRTHLAIRDLSAAQLLLTYSDLGSEERRTRILRTLDALLELRTVIPIINENDSVAVEELRFGDNDALSAHVAAMVGATALVMLTSVDGLMRETPQGPELVPVVTHLAEARAHVRNDKGDLSVGGMQTKLDAVAHTHKAGLPAFIANGKQAWRLPALLDGTDHTCTHFPLPLNASLTTPASQP